jgi:hypothetical protein
MVDRMRKAMTALLCAASSFALVGCGGAILSPEQEIPLIQQQYRRVGGSASGIYENALKVFEKLSITVTDERPGASLIGKMNIKQKPVWVYFKIASGDWVNVRLYNLEGAEEDKWRSRIFKELEWFMRGGPQERAPARRG